MILGLFESWAQFLEVVGVWLAAIATFAAAYTALYVANKANRQSVKLIARPMIEVTRGVKGSTVELFCISATNLGTRPVTINTIAMTSRFPRYDAILMEGLHGSSPLPVTLADGERGYWKYPEITNSGENWYRGLAEHFKDHQRITAWLAIKNMRFFVTTTLGNKFYASRSSEFQNKVLEQLKTVMGEKS